MNYTGLRKRETYDEIIDYLANDQEIIRYPDRWAKRIREHPYLTQLDGEGVNEMTEQQEAEWREHEKEQRVREVSSKSSQTAQLLRATSSQTEQPSQTTQVSRSTGVTGASSSYQFPGHKPDSEMDDFMDITLDEARKREREASDRHEAKRANLRRIVATHLGEEPGEIPYISSSAASRSRTPKKKPVVEEKKLVVVTKAEPMDDKTSVKRGRSIEGGDVKRRNTAETKVSARVRAASVDTGTVKRSKARVRGASADDVQVTGLNMNRKTDMSFWSQQSANELRTQIGMRPGQIRADYAFKSRQDLIEHVRKMIAAGTW